MAVFEYKNKNFYIDDGLKRQLDEKVLPDLKKKDKDVVFIVDGKERGGKSKFADILQAYVASVLETDYDLDNVCMTPEEFRNKVQSANKNEGVTYDEAHRGMGSRRALSEVNNILIDLMMEMGQRNLFVVVVLPTFFMLDRYPALYRARGLFHVYERKGQRGFWVYFNERKKQELYIKGKKLLNYNCMHWPKFRGRFYNQYSIDEEEYRKKKAKAFNDKPRLTKAETYIDQRDILLHVLSKELDLGEIKLAKLLKEYKFPLKHSVIGMILKEMKGKYAENVGNSPNPEN